MRKQVAFRIDTEVYKQFQIMAIQANTTGQKIIEKFITEYVNRKPAK